MEGRECGRYLLGQVSHGLQCAHYQKKKPVLQGWHCDSAFSLVPLCPAWAQGTPVAPLHPCSFTVPVSSGGEMASSHPPPPNRFQFLSSKVSEQSKAAACLIRMGIWSLGGSKMKYYRDHDEHERDPTAGVFLEQSSLKEWSSPPGTREQDLKCRRITYAKP